jgi:hypothetical protein
MMTHSIKQTGPSRNDRGMAFLLEIILGIGIFATIWLLAFGIFTTTRMSVLQSKNHLQATNLARQVMEQALGQPYPTSALGDTFWTLHSTHNDVEVSQVYIYRVEVTDLNPPDPLQSVMVKVRWAHSETERELTLQCYKAPF